MSTTKKTNDLSFSISAYTAFATGGMFLDLLGNNPKGVEVSSAINRHIETQELTKKMIAFSNGTPDDQSEMLLTLPLNSIKWISKTFLSLIRENNPEYIFGVSYLYLRWVHIFQMIDNLESIKTLRKIQNG